MAKRKTVAEQRHNRQVREEQKKSLREAAQKYWEEWGQQQQTKKEIAEKAKENFKGGWTDTQKKMATIIELLESYFGEEYSEDRFSSGELIDRYDNIFIRNESLPTELQGLNLTENEMDYINDVMEERGYERKLVKKEERKTTDFARSFASFFKKDNKDNGGLISPKFGF